MRVEISAIGKSEVKKESQQRTYLGLIVTAPTAVMGHFSKPFPPDEAEQRWVGAETPCSLLVDGAGWLMKAGPVYLRRCDTKRRHRRMHCAPLLSLNDDDPVVGDP